MAKKNELTEVILDICKNRKVEISARYEPFTDSIIIKMRKGYWQINKPISYDILCSAFALPIRDVLRRMADELDKMIETGGDSA